MTNVTDRTFSPSRHLAAILGVAAWDRDTFLAMPFRQPGMMLLRPLVHAWVRNETQPVAERIADLDAYNNAVDALFAEICQVRGIERPAQSNPFDWPHDLHTDVHHVAQLLEDAFKTYTLRQFAGDRKPSLSQLLKGILDNDRHCLSGAASKLPAANVSAESVRLADLLGEFIVRTADERRMLP